MSRPTPFSLSSGLRAGYIGFQPSNGPARSLVMPAAPVYRLAKKTGPSPEEIANIEDLKKQVAKSPPPVFNLPKSETAAKPINIKTGESYTPSELATDRASKKPKVSYPVSTIEGSPGLGNKVEMPPDVHERLASIGLKPVNTHHDGSVTVQRPPRHQYDLHGGETLDLTPHQIAMMVETDGAHHSDLPPKLPAETLPEPDSSQYGMTRNDQDILEEKWKQHNADRNRNKAALASYSQEVAKWKDRAWRRSKEYQPMGQGGPARKFNPDLQEQVFPVEDLGHQGIQGYLKDLESAGSGKYTPDRMFSTVGQGSLPKHDAAYQALDVITASAQAHGTNNSSRMRQDPVGVATGSKDLPVGHVRVAPIHPGSSHHVVQIHHPQGTVTTYRARLNEDDTGYR